ncbi:hypothetical protein DFH09DRAFT_1113019 [Mycena vulgaris]|nr:hypothetical protein DFH09DRAFT_1113019 [Mycena vulgaris]
MPRSSRNNRNSVRQVIVTRKQPKKWWTQSAPGAPLKFTTHGIGKKLAKKHDVDTTRSTSSGDVAVILLYTEREESDDDSYDDDQDYSYLPEVSPTCGDSTTSAPALTFPPPHVMMAAAPSPQENQVSLVDESSAEDQMDVDPTSVPTCATPLITKPQLTPSNIFDSELPPTRGPCTSSPPLPLPPPQPSCAPRASSSACGPRGPRALGWGGDQRAFGLPHPEPQGGQRWQNSMDDGRSTSYVPVAGPSSTLSQSERAPQDNNHDPHHPVLMMPPSPTQSLSPITLDVTAAPPAASPDLVPRPTIKMTLHEWRARKRKRKDDEKQTQAEVREREPEQGRECEQDKERECEKNTRGANMENEVVPGKPVDSLTRYLDNLRRCAVSDKSPTRDPPLHEDIEMPEAVPPSLDVPSPAKEPMWSSNQCPPKAKATPQSMTASFPGRLSPPTTSSITGPCTSSPNIVNFDSNEPSPLAVNEHPPPDPQVAGLLEKSHSPIPLLSPNALNAGMLHLPDAPNRPSPSTNITDTPTAAPTAFVKHLAFRNPASAQRSAAADWIRQELNHSVDVGTVAVVSLPNIKHPTAALPNEMRISWDPRTEMRARLWICDEEVLSVQDILDRAYTLGCPLRIWMPAAMHRPADPPCYRLIPKLPHAVHKPLSAQTLALYEANVEEIFARLHTRAALLEGGILWRIGIEWAPRQSVDNLWQPGYAAEGSTTFDPNVDGFRFCLTQNEIDTLLGCTQSGSQIWPPLEFFERYDMWPGQWTQGNETWFAARVHDIRMRHDRGLTRTKSKWRSQLPLFSHEKMQDIRTPGRAPEAKSLIAKIKADFPKAFEGIHLTPVD